MAMLTPLPFSSLYQRATYGCQYSLYYADGIPPSSSPIRLDSDNMLELHKLLLESTTRYGLK